MTSHGFRLGLLPARVRRDCWALDRMLRVEGGLSPEVRPIVADAFGWDRFRHWRAAMAMLSPGDAFVLRRWLVEGALRCDVAAELGCSTGALSERKHRALLRLRIACRVLELVEQSGAVDPVRSLTARDRPV